MGNANPEAQKWGNKEKYDQNYGRIFGNKCECCLGRGYLEDPDSGKMIRTTCIVCGGTGREKLQ